VVEVGSYNRERLIPGGVHHSWIKRPVTSTHENCHSGPSAAVGNNSQIEYAIVVKVSNGD
jgi:hypothetical protein